MCFASAGRQRQAMIALRRRSAAAAISRDHPSHGRADDRNGELLHCKLPPRASSNDPIARTTSPDAPFSNPHSPARHRHPAPGPRFPPPRRLGRLPPEPVTLSFSGRHPRSLNDQEALTIPDLPALALERGDSILSGHSAPRYEIEMSATPGPSRECRFGKSDKLFQPFRDDEAGGLSFALSIRRSIKRRIIGAGGKCLLLGLS